MTKKKIPLYGVLKQAGVEGLEAKGRKKLAAWAEEGAWGTLWWRGQSLPAQGVHEAKQGNSIQVRLQQVQ